MLQSRADHSFDKELLRLLRPTLLIVDDFGLQKLTPNKLTTFTKLSSNAMEPLPSS